MTTAQTHEYTRCPNCNGTGIDMNKTQGATTDILCNKCNGNKIIRVEVRYDR